MRIFKHLFARKGSQPTQPEAPVTASKTEPRDKYQAQFDDFRAPAEHEHDFAMTQEGWCNNGRR